MTDAQLLSNLNTLLASGSGINAVKHRQMETYVIDYLRQQQIGIFPADNYASVQAAIDAAELNNGGLVYLGAKTYLVSVPLRIKKANVGIIGCGNASRLISTADSGHIIAAYPDLDPTIGGAFGGIRFKDFFIDSSVNRTFGCAIYTRWTHNSSMFDVNIGSQQFNGTDPVFIYDGVSFEKQSACVFSGGQVTCKHIGYLQSSQKVGGGIGSAGIGSNWYNGLITGNAGFWGDVNGGNYITGSRGILLQGGNTAETANGGIQIETCSVSYFEHGIMTSGTNRELFINDCFPADSCGGSGIRITGKLGILQITGGWAAGCGRGTQTPKHGLYVENSVVGEMYNSPKNLQVNISGGTYHSCGAAGQGSGIYIGVGDVTITGTHSYSNAGPQVTLGANVTSASIIGGNIATLQNSSAIVPKIRGVLGLADAG